MTPPDPPDDGGETSPGVERILVVEDDEGLADLFRDWLTRFYGAQVHVANTAADAEATLDSLPALDVAVVDRDLPDGAGEDLLTGARESGATTVMVTGVPPDSDLLALPVDDYLVKPVDEETFLERLSLLEKLDAAGALDEYSDARKASLLEYHLEDPDTDPLFRQFTARWTYDRLEIASVEGRHLVYELYTAGDGVSVSVAGVLDGDLDDLLAAGEITPVGELVPSGGGYAWLDASGGRIETTPDAVAIYRFTCDTPEQYVGDVDPDPAGMSHTELRELLEAEFG